MNKEARKDFRHPGVSIPVPGVPDLLKVFKPALRQDYISPSNKGNADKKRRKYIQALGLGVVYLPERKIRQTFRSDSDGKLYSREYVGSNLLPGKITPDTKALPPGHIRVDKCSIVLHRQFVGYPGYISRLHHLIRMVVSIGCDRSVVRMLRRFAVLFWDRTSFYFNRKVKSIYKACFHKLLWLFRSRRSQDQNLPRHQDWAYFPDQSGGTFSDDFTNHLYVPPWRRALRELKTRNYRFETI